PENVSRNSRRLQKGAGRPGRQLIGPKANVVGRPKGVVDERIGPVALRWTVQYMPRKWWELNPRSTHERNVRIGLSPPDDQCANVRGDDLLHRVEGRKPSLPKGRIGVGLPAEDEV